MLPHSKVVGNNHSSEDDEKINILSFLHALVVSLDIAAAVINEGGGPPFAF